MAIVKDFRWKPAQSTGLPWLRAQFLATAGVTGTALRFQWDASDFLQQHCSLEMKSGKLHVSF
jgi:hypothetical protein